MADRYDFIRLAPDPYAVRPQNPEQALAIIEWVLSQCNGSEMMVVAPMLSALKKAMLEVEERYNIDVNKPLRYI